MEHYEVRPKDKEILIRMLSALFPGVKIYLFGSYARGTALRSSDIDIALDTGRELTLLEIAKAKNVIEALNIIIPVDVVCLNRIPQALREVIQTEGVLWTK